MRLTSAAAFFLALLFLTPAVRAEDWPRGSAALLAQAQQQPEYAAAMKLSPAFYPTSDGRSFFLVWQPEKTPPLRWIVSLPGTRGYATKDFTIWQPLVAGRGTGYISFQLWLGTGNTPRNYYAPQDAYREIDALLAKLGVAPGSALLMGFSRGSANVYAVAALDRVRGRRYFSTVVASSGGASQDYPPTKAIVEGQYGAKPFAGTRWVTACGGNDPTPERDGCPAMRRTAAWLTGLGADNVMQIEDAQEGHGALNRNPQNAAKMLDFWLGG